MKLTSLSRFAGCGAKLGPGLLDKALCGLSQPDYPGLIADFRHSEDAGVLKLNDEQALIQTVDFFPPIVDDPFLYGRIAAANALSDIYAMGGEASTAVCIVGFPVDSLALSVLRLMMDGGLSALKEAECPLVGGHSIDDRELKIGYSVTGLVHPLKVWLNNSVKGGEKIILTKPIGTGLINNASRKEQASEEALAAAAASMGTLNRRAARILRNYPVAACTDVTGFGLLGHAAEMVTDSPCDIRIHVEAVPLLPSVKEYASLGMIPGGTHRNREFRVRFIRNPDSCDEVTLNVLFDPQTSGGLLAAVGAGQAEAAVKALVTAGIPAAIVGETTGGEGMIRLA